MNLKGSAEIYGVVGYPVKHSLSPVFQNRAFEHLGLEAVYIPFEVPPEGLESFIEGLRQIRNLRGINVTVPHKEEVLKLADFLSDEVREIGSANTLRFSEERIEAFNTDWIGFLRAVELITEIKGKRVLVLGAGGASRAVVYALKKGGAEVSLWNRTRERAESLSEEFGVKLAEDLEEEVRRSEVIVNTTSVGLRDEDPSLFNYELLREDQAVVDIIYRETPLIRKAKEKGCRYQTGFPMLVYQGAESFRIWTGCEPPLKVMELSLGDYGYPTESSRTHPQT